VIKNMANHCTVLRIVLSPIVGFSYFFASGIGGVFVFLGFVVAMLTDFMDGYIARSTNTQSRFGRDLDPLADKMLAVFVLPFIVAKHCANGWLVCAVVVIIARELFVTGMRSIAGEKKIQVTALSKFKTFFQLTSMALFVFPWHYCPCVAIKIVPVLTGMMVGAAVLSVLSAWGHVRQFIDFYIKEYR